MSNHYVSSFTYLCYFLQVEMTGSSVFDYIHQADHSELAEQLGLGLTQGQGMASPSPSSTGSEEGSSNVGTANPDGKFSSLQTTLATLYDVSRD